MWKMYDKHPGPLNRKERASYTIEALRKAIPRPETELNYRNEYELIVAVILSAQCTDERVNKVTPALFNGFPTIDALAGATPDHVYPYIKSVSYPNNKSKHLVGMATKVRDEFGGAIPETIPDLVKLPGVGRKTAQVVASVAFDVDAIPVDTHVFRVANRIGLTTNAPTPLKVEQQLKKVIPKDEWSESHHLLILHGRYTCLARAPKCDVCPLTAACLYYERLQKLPPPLEGLDRKKGKFYCKTKDLYFDTPDYKTDRYDIEQIACPSCQSMNVYETKTGRTTKKIPDFRVN